MPPRCHVNKTKSSVCFYRLKASGGVVVPGGVGLLWTYILSLRKHFGKGKMPWCTSEGTERWVYPMLTENKWVYFVYSCIPALHCWWTAMTWQLYFYDSYKFWTCWNFVLVCLISWKANREVQFSTIYFFKYFTCWVFVPFHLWVTSVSYVSLWAFWFEKENPVQCFRLFYVSCYVFI